MHTLGHQSSISSRPCSSLPTTPSQETTKYAPNQPLVLRDIEPVSENKQLSKRARVEAGYQLADGEENKSLSEDASGLDAQPENKLSKLRKRSREKAGIDSSYGEENKGFLGFACPDYSDFELDLAKDALKSLEDKKEDTGEYEVAQVMAACFAFSWPTTRCCAEQCHIIFSAKPKNNADASFKWFFAEFEESRDGVSRPSRAEMLDPCNSGLKYGCEMCPPHMLYPHPPGFGIYVRDQCPGQSALQFTHRHKVNREETGAGEIQKKVMKKSKAAAQRHV